MKSLLSVGHKSFVGLLSLVLTGSVFAGSFSMPSYVKQGVDFSKYHKVMVMPLDLDNVKVIKPVWEQGNKDKWSYEKGTGAQVQALYMAAMKQALETDGGFQVVTEAGDDTLLVEVEVLSITPYVKPGMATKDDKYEIETLGSGELVGSAELRDSNTRELLMLVEGTRVVGDEYKKVTKENHRDNLAKLFAQWGTRISHILK